MVVVVVRCIGGRGRGGPFGRGIEGGGCEVLTTSVPFGLQSGQESLITQVDRRLGGCPFCWGNRPPGRWLHLERSISSSSATPGVDSLHSGLSVAAK